VLLIWRHRSNIAKLRNGTESKLGSKAKPSKETTS
jgi:glycerol-3-phosphate acyltransferase PlsY